MKRKKFFSSVPPVSAVSTLEAQFYPGGREVEPQIKIKAGKFVVQKNRDALRSGNVDDAIRSLPANRGNCGKYSSLDGALTDG